MDNLIKHLMENEALVEITSVDHCFETFISGNLASPFYYFRGLSNSNYDLLTTLDRFQKDEWGGKEKLLIREFKKIARNYISPQMLPTSTFEWLALMQHYGIPTRLLDVTNSAFIALYFAVKDWDNNCDGAVWAINPYRFHDNSLYRLTENSFPFPIEKSHSYHLPQFTKEEYFNEAFLTAKYQVCMILEPEIAERRLFQQQGAFMVTSCKKEETQEILIDVLKARNRHDDEFERMGKGKGGKSGLNWSIVKVVIPAKEKKRIFHQLMNMNVNASTLFPDIAGAANYVKEFVKSSDYIGNRWNLKT